MTKTTIKVIQVNIYKGKYLESLIEFLKREDPDIITMQEVSAGAINLYQDKSVNLFNLLKQKLGYSGVFHSGTEIVADPQTRFGNAVFTKWPILGSEVAVLNTFRPITMAEFSNSQLWDKFPRQMLDTTVKLDRLQLQAISVHGRRIAPPVDNEESIRQARIAADHLVRLGDTPFILGGDLNMPPESEVIKIISRVANNLMKDSGVNQTLNPHVHELGDKGYLVDYIFTSKHFKLRSLKVPQVTISDHLPVVTEVELLN